MHLAHHHAGLQFRDDRAVEVIKSTAPLFPHGDNGKLRVAGGNSRRPPRTKNMNSDDIKLQELLRGHRPMPALPPRFQQNVWRRIEDAEVPAKSPSWLDALATLILRPRFAMAAATVMLLAGVFTGTLKGWQLARHDAQMNYLASVAPHAAR